MTQARREIRERDTRSNPLAQFGYTALFLHGVRSSLRAEPGAEKSAEIAGIVFHTGGQLARPAADWQLRKYAVASPVDANRFDRMQYWFAELVQSTSIILREFSSGCSIWHYK